jgi:hypothetical protein
MDNKAQKKLFDALRAVDTPTICNALEEARGFRTASGFTTQHMHPTEADAPPLLATDEPSAGRDKTLHGEYPGRTLLDSSEKPLQPWVGGGMG